MRQTHPASYRTPPLTLGLAGMLLLIALAPGIAVAQLIPSFGSDRAGTSGFQFLKIPVDARSAAMGETVAANAMDASALFWNPALAAQTERNHIGFNHTAYYVDVMLDYAGFLYHLPRFDLTIGASLQALNSGEMDVTTEFEPFGTGETFNFIDLATGLTIAQELTDLFSYGVTAKYVRESVAGVTASTVVFDLGIFYRIGTSGVQMAVAMRNFGLDSTPTGAIDRTVIGQGGIRREEEFTSLTPPTTFLLGLTYHVFQQDAMHDLLVSGQLNNPNDNAESFNIGLEYTWNSLLILRSGYRFGIEEYTIPSAGLGVDLGSLISVVGARLDYGFSHLDRLGTVHRLGMDLSF